MLKSQKVEAKNTTNKNEFDAAFGRQYFARF